MCWALPRGNGSRNGSHYIPHDYRHTSKHLESQSKYLAIGRALTHVCYATAGLTVEMKANSQSDSILEALELFGQVLAHCFVSKRLPQGLL